jgi:hypothetical protein
MLDVLSWLFSHVPPWVCIPVAIIGSFVIPAWISAQMKTPEIKSLVEIFGWFLGGLWAIVWLAGGLGGWLKRRK